MNHSAYTSQYKTFRTAVLASAISLGAFTLSSKAVSIVFSNQVNAIETSVNSVLSSAFFTATPDNGLTFTNIATTISPGLIGGDLGAGDGSVATSTGTITVVGGATSAGN